MSISSAPSIVLRDSHAMRELKKKNKKKKKKNSDSKDKSKDKDSDDDSCLACELGEAPYGPAYIYTVLFEVLEPGIVEFDITCSGEPGVYFEWEGFPSDKTRCLCTVDEDAGAGLIFDEAGMYEVIQLILCPPETMLEIEITSGDILDGIIITDVYCLGSLEDITACTNPGGSVYSSDLDIANGDERFFWDMGGQSEIGASMTVSCPDLICPINLPCEFADRVFFDIIDYEYVPCQDPDGNVIEVR